MSIFLKETTSILTKNNSEILYGISFRINKANACYFQSSIKDQGKIIMEEKRRQSKYNIWHYAFLLASFTLLVLQCLMLFAMAYILTEQKTLSFELQELITGIKGQENTLITSSSGDKLNTPMQLLKAYSLQSNKERLLNTIKLPKKPTENDKREYIRKIQATTINQRSFSSNDPQIDKLVEVGPESLNLLIETLDNNQHGMSDCYINYAIERLVKESHKDLIIKNLNRHKELINVVIKMGWEKDVKEIILQGLQANSNYLPTGWIRVAAEFEDKEFKQPLIDYFVNGCNKNWTYKAIMYRKDIDLKDAVNKAWLRAKYSDSQCDINSMARIAVEYGNKEALKVLIDSLAAEKHDWDYDQIRQALRFHIDFAGSDKEIIQWYRANRNKLVFDNDSKKFKLPE